jgi:hypothetical protein
MKNATRKELEASRPGTSACEAVRRCLKHLYRDREHRVEVEIVRGLTYEELIGSLLLVRDFLEGDR